jgi:Tfp pilus assembly protein PilF
VFAALLIAIAAAVAYANSFQGAFVFDDIPAIMENPTIRSLWPIGPVLSMHHNGSPVDGRPVVNLTLAINYALGGTRIWGYHAVNLAIHILAALTLFGILRRTLRLSGLRERFEGRADLWALAVAMVWMVHPLQTESVTYISQRAESLAGLLSLLTLYCCIRAFEADKALKWKIAAIGACLVGMATKETLVAVPLLVLLYDRTFVSHSFREAVKRRWGLYLSLAATWGLLAVVVIHAKSRGGTAGFGHGISSWDYACTQFGAIVHYLRLSFWPAPLVIDYGTGLATGPAQIVPFAIAIGLLVILTVVAIRYWPWAGFLGAWFFMILAPSSSVVPVVTQTMAEHRMYLPLAAVTVLAVVPCDWAWRRLTSAEGAGGKPGQWLRWAIPLAMAGALIAGGIYLTAVRNEDYRSELALWTDTVGKVPDNSRAHNNLGFVLSDRGRIDEAITNYRQALKLDPNNAEAHVNLGCDLATQGRLDEAMAHYHQALRLGLNSADVHNNMGNVFCRVGRFSEAIAQYEKALRLRPDYPDAHNNLGIALAAVGRMSEAIAQYEKALRLRPDYPDTHNNLGNALCRLGRFSEAIPHFQEALRLQPDYPQARKNLELALQAQQHGQ